MIIKNSKKEEDFINELKNIIDNINTSNICDRELLEKLYKNMLLSQNLSGISTPNISKLINILKYGRIKSTIQS